MCGILYKTYEVHYLPLGKTREYDSNNALI